MVRLGQLRSLLVGYVAIGRAEVRSETSVFLHTVGTVVCHVVSVHLPCRLVCSRGVDFGPCGTALSICIFMALAKITGGLQSGLHLSRSMFLVLVSARIVSGVQGLCCGYMELLA
jgi:hypothetical protein